MAVLIDSSILVGWERGGFSAAELTTVVPNDDSAIASITVSELLAGVHRADNSGRRSRRETFVEAIIRTFTILDFDLAAARVHARLSAEMARTGVTIGAHDLIIAATALAHRSGVLTANERDFRRVPGLVIVFPTW